jgi:hypothetical protein
MIRIFFLTHDFETKSQPDNPRYLGIYSSYDKALDAQKRYLQMRGFKDFPSGFVIDEIKIGEDRWTYGF